MRRRLFVLEDQDGVDAPWEREMRKLPRPRVDDSHGYGPPLFDTDPFTDDDEETR